MDVQWTTVMWKKEKHLPYSFTTESFSFLQNSIDLSAETQSLAVAVSERLEPVDQLRTQITMRWNPIKYKNQQCFKIIIVLNGIKAYDGTKWRNVWPKVMLWNENKIAVKVLLQYTHICTENLYIINTQTKETFIINPEKTYIKYK